MLLRGKKKILKKAMIFIAPPHWGDHRVDLIDLQVVHLALGWLKKEGRLVETSGLGPERKRTREA